MNTRILTLGLTLSACGADATLEPITTFVNRELKLAREVPEGVSPGFNLDGAVSTTLDIRSCNKEDFTDEGGAIGIDNQLARLLPLVDLAGQGAIDALVQAAIGEGRLLMLTTLEPREDGTVLMRVERGDGVPLLGTDGKLLSGQTIPLHAERELGRATLTRDASGAYVSERFGVKLPIVIFGILYLLDLPEAIVRFTVSEEGELLTGLLGGAVPVEQLLGFAKQAGDSSGNDFVSTFGDGIRDAADMERDPATGLCTKMSLAATFSGVPAFVF